MKNRDKNIVQADRVINNSKGEECSLSGYNSDLQSITERLNPLDRSSSQPPPRRIEDLCRDNRGGYSVPDGYFSDLNQKIMAQIEQPANESVSRWVPFKSLVAFAGGFAALAIIATAGFMLTGKGALEEQSQMIVADNEDHYLNVNLYDLIENQDAGFEYSSEMFDDQALAYLDTYGFDLTDIIIEE